jgi:hypothetical protein
LKTFSIFDVREIHLYFTIFYVEQEDNVPLINPYKGDWNIDEKCSISKCTHILKTWEGQKNMKKLAQKL